MARAAVSARRGGTQSSAKAHALGFAGVDVAAGKHHVQRLGRGDPFRQPFHAAPAGKDAEHHFGQRQLGGRLVHHHEVTASQRQFQAAADAVAANQRQRRIGNRRQPVVEIPAPGDQGAGRLCAIEAGEFLDVGPGDEAGRLAGAEDQTLRRFAVELIEQLRQFRHHIRR